MNRGYQCVCGQALFFRNTQCIKCNRALGYSTETQQVEPLEPAETPDTFRFTKDTSGQASLWRRCANLTGAAGCNWLIPAVAGSESATLCISCNLNHTVADLTVAKNAKNFRKVDLAKRRVISAVMGLGLPIGSTLRFDFLAPVSGGPAVMTGHNEGLITINLDEADDALRESVRAKMHEPYRTVLGHIRHEIGHAYWDLLIRDTEWHARFREVFGDESQDYGQALERHYSQGAPAGWPEHFISSYATSHPWEDWAESFAHYLHMVDAVDTAASLNINLGNASIESTDDILPPPHSELPVDPTEFSRLFDSWLKVVLAMNQMSRSMGQADFYPFYMSLEARTKVEFVHLVVAAKRAKPAEAVP